MSAKLIIKKGGINLNIDELIPERTKLNLIKNSLVFEDSYNGVRAAKADGMHICWVTDNDLQGIISDAINNIDDVLSSLELNQKYTWTIHSLLKIDKWIDYLTKEIELDIDNDTSFSDSKDDGKNSYIEREKITIDKVYISFS
ncbi:hypothetical protein RhiirC2_717202 [Rhizophagus irregularis]|uniref:Uncharacterized protein n=1 Tax=Rhizophagus irregularis TaxID=588596 RepID=A0A2N1MNE8_9GLOM|nr:hypothetical protein RhiirC2_717202 [Rhizophagus irregularis]